MDKQREIISVDEYKAMLKKNKYRNRRIVVNGIKFQSVAESEFYRLLYQLNVYHKRQVRFDLRVNDVLICYYYADFVVPVPGQPDVVIDIKGMETRDFKIKRKLMKAIYDIDVICLRKNELRSWALLLKNRQQSPEIRNVEM